VAHGHGAVPARRLDALPTLGPAPGSFVQMRYAD